MVTSQGSVENERKYHPGLDIALKRFEATDGDIVRALISGELASPHHFINSHYFRIRISGTGLSFRPALQEHVWRNPAVYLNQDFLDRVSGLPVIWAHPPEKQILDTDEFAKRIIGTVIKAYIANTEGVEDLENGDEVWGVARILDVRAAQLMRDKKLSTSPAVLLSPGESEREKLNNDEHLLVEGGVKLADHIAVVEHGVWDHAGPPSGIDNGETRNDDAGTPANMRSDEMAEEKDRQEEHKEEEKKEEEVKEDSRMDAVAGEKLDKLLSGLDSLSKRMDAWDAERASRKRDDAEDKDEDEDEEEKEEEREDSRGRRRARDDDDRGRDDDDDDDRGRRRRARDDDDRGRDDDDDDDDDDKRGRKDVRRGRKDARKPRRVIAMKDDDDDDDDRKRDDDDDDDRKRDDEDEELEESQAKRLEQLAEEERKEGKKDARRPRMDARSDSRVSKLEAELAMLRNTLNRPPDETALYAAAQAKADAVYQMYGDRAPSSLTGETLVAYRLRLVKPMQMHSAKFKDVALASVAAADAAVFGIAEDTIYADAAAAVRNNVGAAGHLRRERYVDQDTHQTFTRWHGDPNVWMDQFKTPYQVALRDRKE